MQKKNLVLLLATIFVLSACSPKAPTMETVMDKPSEEMMDTQTVDLMEAPSEVMPEAAKDSMTETDMMTPSFFKTSLTNVNNGESFTISDFAGKVVLVENLAMWCPNCKKQQEQVKILSDTLGMNSDFIAIGFDIDPNEKADDLKRYTESNGFDWIYAVPPQEVLNEISSLYGVNFLNPPSTPIFVIDRKGEVHLMPFGIKSADDLQKFIDPFLAEGM